MMLWAWVSVELATAVCTMLCCAVHAAAAAAGVGVAVCCAVHAEVPRWDSEILGGGRLCLAYCMANRVFHSIACPASSAYLNCISPALTCNTTR